MISSTRGNCGAAARGWGGAGLSCILPGSSASLSRTSRGEFVIHEQIRFPAGLAGHAVKFLLLRDVPMPEGDPGDAMLISEETGMVIDPKRH